MMQFSNLTENEKVLADSSATGKSVLDKYSPYTDNPRIRERVECMQELKKQWQDARGVIRSLGGDAMSDNSFLNEP